MKRNRYEHAGLGLGLVLAALGIGFAGGLWSLLTGTPSDMAGPGVLVLVVLVWGAATGARSYWRQRQFNRAVERTVAEWWPVRREYPDIIEWLNR